MCQEEQEINGMEATLIFVDDITGELMLRHC